MIAILINNTITGEDNPQIVHWVNAIKKCPGILRAFLLSNRLNYTFGAAANISAVTPLAYLSKFFINCCASSLAFTS